MLTLIIFFCVISSVVSTDYTKCKSGELPMHVQINNCTTLPCIFVSGSPLDANVTFDAPYDVMKMETSVIVSIFGIPVEYSDMDKDTCKYLTRGWCPLEEGERAIYNFRMQLPPIPAVINLNLEIVIKALEEEKKKDIVCFKITGRTQPL